MASFRTHICFGIALGVVGVIGLATMSIAGVPSFLVVVFALAVLGSVLPDMDSDTSTPFHIAFGSLAIIAGTLTFITVHKQAPSDWRTILLFTGGVAAFVWMGIGYAFKRFTRHRGMAHSLPAALLSGLAVFFLAGRFSFSDEEAFILGVAVVAGYLIHLVLDEVYAAVNFHGHNIGPNKAFGSALKLKSKSGLVNLVVYGAIVLLLMGNTTRLLNLARELAVHLSK